jgi:hypothetical protein
VCDSRCPRAESEGSPTASYRRAKVRFAPSSTILFRSDEPPVAVLGLAVGPPCWCVKGTRSRLYSILKKPYYTKLAQEKILPATGSLASTAHSSCPPASSLNSDRCAAQDDGGFEQGWCLVRRRRWWRKERLSRHARQPSAQHMQGKLKFRERMHGRCFNCLALDHKVEHCRDPTRCWRCKGNGHVSSQCPSKRIECAWFAESRAPASLLPLPLLFCCCFHCNGEEVLYRKHSSSS